MVETGYSTASLASCEIDSDGTIELYIAPEDEPPINCSPWFGFRVRTTDVRAVERARLNFNYIACEHRYRPKTSVNFRDWTALDQMAEKDGSSSFAIEVGYEPVYVSAQEPLPVATYESWIYGLVEQGKARSFKLGESAGGRPITAMAFGNMDAKRIILVLGRQHPPEIPGSRALFAFVETLASGLPEATAFRDDTLTLVVPVVNPDGVELGHWRHNSSGKDLNRDWGKFTQPETRAVQSYLDSVLERGGKLSLLLDFHSTGRDVLYTLPEGTRTQPADFTPIWVDALERRLPQFSFAVSPGYTAGSGVAKNYFHKRYGVPGITVELGDETDRVDIARAGQVAALAMFDVFAEREN